jgi:murein DD-endopeptidase MepM/ murein hydrolase activator NlpD
MERMPQPTRAHSPSPVPALVASAFSILAALTCFGGAVGAVLDSPATAAGSVERLPAETLMPVAAGGEDTGPAVALAAYAAPPPPVAEPDTTAPTGAGIAPAAAVQRRTVAIERGDTLSGVLGRAGVSPADGRAVVEALRAVLEPRSIRPGGSVEVAFAADPAAGGGARLMEVTLAADARREATAARGSDGGFAASVRDLAAGSAPALASGVIRSSLFADAAAAGAPDAVILEMIRAFSYDVDFQRDIHPGDRFSILFEQVSGSDGAVLASGELLHARLVLAGEEHSLYRHVDAGGEAGYYRSDGRSVRTALLRTPVNGARLSSAFGMRRHPVLGFSRMHRGIDFAAPVGTPIYAAGDGKVGFVGRNSGYGNYVRIDHDARYATAYAHLSRFATGLKVHAQVKQGQVIGYVGSTGVSTGPHLHYEILVDGSQVNPLEVKTVDQARLPADEMSRFAAAVAEVDGHHARLAGGAVATASTGR